MTIPFAFLLQYFFSLICVLKTYVLPFDLILVVLVQRLKLLLKLYQDVIVRNEYHIFDHLSLVKWKYWYFATGWWWHYKEFLFRNVSWIGTDCKDEWRHEEAINDEVEVLHTFQFAPSKILLFFVLFIVDRTVRKYRIILCYSLRTHMTRAPVIFYCFF